MSRLHRRPLPWVLAVLALGACSASGPEPGRAVKGEIVAPPGYTLAEAELPNDSTVAGLVAEISPSVVSVVVTQKVAPVQSPFGGFPGFGGPAPEREGAGSGFVVDSAGHVVTNEHVVRDAASLRVRLNDDREFEAEVIGRDPKLDLALLRIKGPGPFEAVRLGNSDALRVGEHVVAVGNPFGLGHTVTLGIVSAKARTIGAGPYDDFIQTDASINPGNSGGPLFNLRGEVVGINTAIRQGADGIGFAIPVDDLKDVVGQLRDKGFVERGRLGLRFQAVDDALRKALGLDRATGALVNEVEPDSPAEKAGIEAGDVILSVDDEEVRRAEHLARMVARHAPGETISVALRKRQGTETVKVTLDRLGDPVVEKQPRPAERAGEALLGLKLQPAPGGLRVVQVDDSRAGLRPGDLIIAVDGRSIASVAEMRAAVEESDRSALLFRIRRGEQELFVGVPR